MLMVPWDKGGEVAHSSESHENNRACGMLGRLLRIKRIVTVQRVCACVKMTFPHRQIDSSDFLLLNQSNSTA